MISCGATDVDSRKDIPFAASTAIFSLRTQLNKAFLLFGPGSNFKHINKESQVEIVPKYVQSIIYHKGDQPMTLLVDTRRPVSVGLIHDRIPPNIQDFDGEFVTIDRPKNNQQYSKRVGQHYISILFSCLHVTEKYTSTSSDCVPH